MMKEEIDSIIISLMTFKEKMADIENKIDNTQQVMITVGTSIFVAFFFKFFEFLYLYTKQDDEDEYEEYEVASDYDSDSSGLSDIKAETPATLLFQD
jgi:hypothetical protein